MSTVKNFFKNIIFITALKEEHGFLKVHLDENEELTKRREKGDLILFVYGDKKIKKSILTDVKNFKNAKDLTIPHEEHYTSLSTKTLKSIQFCVENFDFDFLYKADLTKEIDCALLDLDLKDRKDFLGISALRPRKTRWGGFSHRGIFGEMQQCRRRTFVRWAKSRGLDIDPWVFDEGVYYSGWKPYGMSKKFANLIAKYGHNYDSLYREKLAGCEDHMIGKIWKDLNLAHGLTMR